jgi:hypothetical protein
MRRAAVLAALLGLTAPAGAQDAPAILSAAYADPTGRYPHGVLGDALEWGTLEVRVDTCPAYALLTPGDARAVLPDDLVFEDTAPRLADLDGDGRPEVLVVESHRDLGARVAVWGLGAGGLSRLAASDFIGTRFRWIALTGAADLDGDGQVEVVGVDRPHLAKVLRVWRVQGDRLVPVAEAAGHTTHRIGDRDILGGIRDCAGTGDAIVTATPDWARLQVSSFGRDGLRTSDAGRNTPGRLAALMACR